MSYIYSQLCFILIAKKNDNILINWVSLLNVFASLMWLLKTVKLHSVSHLWASLY